MRISDWSSDVCSSDLSSGTLPFGLDAIDRRLPGGGLALGALHEVAGGAQGATDAAAAALFAAVILARVKDKILRCLTHSDLFAPAHALAALDPDRLIHVEAPVAPTTPTCCDQALRHCALSVPLAYSTRLSITTCPR